MAKGQFQVAARQTEDAMRMTREFDDALRSVGAADTTQDLTLRREQVFQTVNAIPVLRGLVRSFQQLQLVNQAFWQRIHDTCHADSNLKAFLTFFSMASSLTYSLETQLQKIRPLVMCAGEGVEAV